MSTQNHLTNKKFIRINTQHINSRTSPIKQRITQQYVPKYSKKLNLSQKQIKQPSEDRLSQLTTKQIDRLIEMQKIKSLLKNNKRGIKPIHIKIDDGDTSNKHSNIYQSNFLAKINRIALERDIKHMRYEQFDENMLTAQEKRIADLNLHKKNLRFIKAYNVDRKKKIKTQSALDQDVKSIESINQSVQIFQQNFQERKAMKRNIYDVRSRYKKTNILSSTRWFDGMSTHYLQKGKKRKISQKQSGIFTFDIEHQKNNSFYRTNTTIV